MNLKYDNILRGGSVPSRQMMIFFCILILSIFYPLDTTHTPQQEQQIVYPRKLSNHKRPKRSFDAVDESFFDSNKEHDFSYLKFPILFQDTDTAEEGSRLAPKEELPNSVLKTHNCDNHSSTTADPNPLRGSASLILAFKKVDNLFSKNFDSDFKNINLKEIASNLYQGYVTWEYGKGIDKSNVTRSGSGSGTSVKPQFYYLTLEYRFNKINALFSTDSHHYELNPLHDDDESRQMLAIITMTGNMTYTSSTSTQIGPHVLKRSRKSADAPSTSSDYEKNYPITKSQSHGKITGPYVLEAIFYIPRKFITIPERHIPFLAAQVNNILRHPSIKVDISMTLKYIRDYPSDYVITDDPKKGLSYMRLYKGSTAPSIDVAILVSNQIKSPLGGTLAYTLVGAVCSTDASVVLAHDRGFDTAHSIAHELGHLLGAKHDMDFPECDSSNTRGIMHYYPLLQYRNTWSKCSADSIANLLRSGTADCLLQSDDNNFDLPLFPGQRVSLDEQCRKNWGLGYYAEYNQSTCQVIKCKRTKIVRGETPLDGTPCENINNGTSTRLLNRDSPEVCYRNQCTRKNTIESAKRGIWSSWGEWSECGGFCPVGFRKRKRSCRFLTEIEGSFCGGDTEEISICTLGCNDTTDSYKQANQKLCDKQKPKSEFRSTSQYPCLIGCYVAPNLFIFYVNVINGTPFNKTALCIEGIVYSYPS